jgi:5-methyltetrahydropteroyltriglutamate--homocysteine methyltransferase
VEEDLPAWCRMTERTRLVDLQQGRQRSFLVAKGKRWPNVRRCDAAGHAARQAQRGRGETAASAARRTRARAAVPPLAVTGMGSWPRPRWLVDAMHAHVEGTAGRRASSRRRPTTPCA